MPSHVKTVPGLEDWVVLEEPADVYDKLEDKEWLSLTLALHESQPLLVKSETVIAVEPL